MNLLKKSKKASWWAYLAAYEQKHWHHVKEHIVLVLEPSKKVAWLAFVAIMSISLL